MDNQAFEELRENTPNVLEHRNIHVDTEIGLAATEASVQRRGYQGQVLSTVHELHNSAFDNNQKDQKSSDQPNTGSRFHVSAVSPGSGTENVQLGPAKIENNIVFDKETQLDTNRKSRIATFNSQERNRKMSRDVIPSIEHYRTNPLLQTTARRPTMHELCHQLSEEVSLQDFDETLAKGSENEAEDEKVTENVKFGWIEGVLIRNMMSIWGVMLFLRLSWVVAHAGIGETLVIIAISTFITLVTALSMSAISTNGEIGGGGTYFVMSRVLGPEFGGSIGIIFAIANAMDCSLNVVGFAQAVQDMMMEYGGYILFDGAYNDIRVIGTITMIFVCAICGLGAQYETKMKDIMFVIMLASLVNFLAGSIMGPSSELEEARGFIGYSMDLLAENWEPAYTVTSGQLQNFISVFSVYFPACIGILAGANVSGELKDPNTAIPKGTILAIIICSISYAGVAIICAATMARQATGNVMDLVNGTHLNCTSSVNGTDCRSGLYYDYQAMSLVSAFGPLNYVGCIAATISSALSDFVSCPALLEVIAADKLYPYWMVGFWGKRSGTSNQPYRAFGFTFVLALAFVLIAQLDMIALLISDFFLATFALMNFSTFHVSLIKPIGWRPTFKYYNTWLSLLTGILSITSMILISLPIAVITIAIVLFFYMVVLYRKPEVNWGSSTQAQTYRAALTSIQQLVHIEEHVKNYRPQILVLTGLPNTRPALVDFAYLICKNNSLMICGNIVEEKLKYETRLKLQQKAYRYLRFTHIKGFCAVADNSNLHTGVAAMLGLAGVGKVKPNILLMGYKNNWSTCDRKALDQYVLTIHTGFEMNVGVAILRLQEGLDCSQILADIDDLIVNKFPKDKSQNQQTNEWSVTSNTFGDYPTGVDTTVTSVTMLNDENKVEETDDLESPNDNEGRRTVVLGVTKSKKSKRSKKLAITYRDPEGNELPKSVMNKIIVFQKKQKKDTIDIWWLSDDGGLTLLLPVIINSRSNWSETKLRIFCTASGVHELEKEQKGMAVLLSKFRIDYSDLVIISDVDEAPKKKTKKWFDGVIRPFLQPGPNGAPPQVTEQHLEMFQYKTNRHLKLRELLLDHSSDSNLVVMTLPMPRNQSFNAPLYMAWLEALTANMPPFMLVRGNQTSVLTFYV
ncbi:bumetanide-sensitive sodium-(potassium)-chloride cotransporter-like isoform X1 [Daphnia carinata]|uniref:bumetanide-sensitive sodium-(potassium)-chloride cotransporter-like isoform X1 n=1 Tax=Daphnia carinata TaxID=120202 RepID=UPI0025797A86|nr:bumetanide-sensitive sodium-(potassium)-chloride cotransporter-like isoform X1 [Daphnia carinata]